MSHGDRREEIFRDDLDREDFLKTLGAACQKTGWQVHAYCLMSNHFHLMFETPRANLVEGMKWLLGTYTMRFNRQHKLVFNSPDCFRLDGAKLPFSLKTAKKLKIREQHVITVTGKAFYDLAHAPTEHSNRRSKPQDHAVWEIHPVMALHVDQ